MATELSINLWRYILQADSYITGNRGLLSVKSYGVYSLSSLGERFNSSKRFLNSLVEAGSSMCVYTVRQKNSP